MNTEKFKGKFIVLDGPDGCGKSSQATLLKEWLESQGVSVELFRDPGGTAIGEKIRHILLNPEHIAMTTSTEVMLYMAARVQLWHEKISPALQQKKTVILDRWLSSNCAYQGYAGEFGTCNIIKIAQDCLEKPWPDLTIILDVDLKTASTRLNAQLDRMEQKGNEYHEKVRQGFLELAKNRKDFMVVDARNDIETVHQQITKKLIATIHPANFFFTIPTSLTQDLSDTYPTLRRHLLRTSPHRYHNIVPLEQCQNGVRKRLESQMRALTVGEGLF